METPMGMAAAADHSNSYGAPGSTGSGLYLADDSARGLVSKNIRIHRKRTSVRLEPQMWNALREISTLEKCTIHDLCTAVSDAKNPAMPFTAALRVFLMEYYRSASRVSPAVTDIQQRIKRAHGQEEAAPAPSVFSIREE